MYALDGGTFGSNNTFSGLAAGTYTVTIQDANNCTDNVSVIISEPSAVTSALSSQTNVNCNGGNDGEVTVSANGGTAGYTYSIDGGTFGANNTFSGLAAGNYTLTVQDANNCTSTTTVSITEPTPVSVSTNSIAHVNCAGGSDGSASINSTGGTGSHTYSLDGGAFSTNNIFSGLAAGNYTVTVQDDNGCTGSVTFAINDGPPNVTASLLSSTDVDCNGNASGSATVNGGGGTGTYTYSLNGSAFSSNPTFSNLSAGSYTATIRDGNGCSATTSFSISEPSAINGNISSQTNVSCNGGNNASVTLSGSGGTGSYMYALDGGTFGSNNTFSGLAAGTYTVTIQDANNCTDNVSVIISEPSAVTSALSSQTNVNCNGGNDGEVTVSANGGTAGYTYSIDGGTFGANNTFSGLDAGNYTLTVQDANNCTSTTTVSITEPPVVALTPTGQTDVSCNGGADGTATVAGSGGVPPYEYSIDGGAFSNTSSFTGLAGGLHTITIQDAHNCTATLNITIAEPNTVAANILAQQDVSCNGLADGEITLLGGGGTGSYVYAIDGGSFSSNNTFSGLAGGSYTLTVQDGNNCTGTTTVNIIDPAPVATQVTSTHDVSCQNLTDGMAIISATGGTNSYTYALNGGTFTPNNAFSGLSGGNYTVDVQDANGCPASTSFTINVPTAVSASITAQTDVSCNGGNDGALTIAATGGVGNYAYSIDGGPFSSTPTFSNLTAGNHTITVQDSNNCPFVFVTNLASPTTSVFLSVPLVVGVDCSNSTDGAVILFGNGGSGTFTYSLDGSFFSPNNSFTNLLPGTYTAFAQDANGCTASTNFTIEVDDAIPPTINCPANINISTDSASCEAIVNVPQPSISDNCPALTYWNDYNNTSDASGTYSIGTTNVTWHVEDFAGNTASCAMNVQVTDTEAPIINCPADITQINDWGMCSAWIVYTEPQGTDNCMATTSLLSGRGQSALFPVGTSMETYIATDSEGNTASCSFSITIQDIEAPLIMCPASVTAETLVDGCHATVTVASPLALDNCPGTVFTNDYNNSTDASDMYPLGLSTVTWTATDGGSNTASCSMTVLVEDEITPTVICPLDIDTTADSLTCDANVTIPIPIHDDNCGISALSNDQTATSNASATYPLGTTMVTYTVWDISGNSSSCSFSVNVTNLTPPSLDCPTNIQQANDIGQCEAMVTVALPAFSSGCGIDNIVNNITNTTDASGSYPVGTTTVTWTASDLEGNTATCSMNITVTDNQAPIITCPSIVTETASFGRCDGIAFYPPPIVSDNCPNTSIINDFNGTDNGAGRYNVGATTVTWTVTDAGNNTASCSMNIVITDIEPPSIVCPSDASSTTDLNQCDAMVSIGSPTSADNCGITSNINDFNGTSDASDRYPIGTTSLIWTVSDIHGNFTTCSMEVTVIDGQAPSISCPSDISQAGNIANCATPVTVPSPTVTDNCPTWTYSNDFNGTTDASDTYPLGTTNLVWTATDDAGHTTSCSMAITVTSVNPPTLICPANIQAPTDFGQCNTTVTVPAPNVSGNCGSPTLLNSYTNTDNASGIYPGGTTTVTWTASDPSGQTSSCDMIVEVVDNQAPTIICPSNIIDDTDPNLCKKLNVIIPDPIINDNCGISSLTNSRTGATNPSGAYSVGTVNLIWIVTDVASQTASCSMSVTIEDHEAPTINCPANQTSTAPNGACDMLVIGQTPLATDACGISSIANDYTNTNNATGMYPLGTTTVTWTATDVHGNTNNCTTLLTVEGTIGQGTASCPTDITQSTDPNACQAFVTIPSLISSGACGVTAAVNDYTNTSNASGIYSVGTTTVNWSLSDANGNTSTCSMNVIIIDDDLSITCPADIVRPVDAGACNAEVIVPAPTPNANCGSINMSNDYNGTQNASGIYPEGITPVTWTASDGGGNTASCSMFILVTDDELPSISCPTDITQGVAGGGCTTDVAVPQPTTSDNCGVAIISNSYTGIFDASAAYPIGTTSVTWTVLDIEGNAASCVMNITVNDNASTCANADLISNLPFSVTDMTTECSGNDYSNADACGSLYMDSEEYVFEYTPTESQSIDLALSNTMPNTALFVFDGCPDISTNHCIHTETSVLGNPSIENLTLQGGITYYIIVSTLPNQAFTPFDLTVSPANCGRDIFEPNESLSTAKALPQIGINLNAQICDEDDHDWYHYTVKESNVQIKLSGLPFNCGLEVILNGNSFVSNELGLANEVIDLPNLTIGDLIQIHVYGADNGSSSQGYNLHVIERASTINITKDNPAQTLSQPAKGPEQLLTDSNIQVLFYPNPTTDKVYLDFEAPASTEALVTFTNVHGQLVQQGQKLVEQGANHWEVNTQKLALGIYFVSFKMDGQEKTFKLIIE